MRASAIALLVTATGAIASGQDHSRCPMHAAPTHQAQVDQRHQDTTGVPTQATEHHFLLSPDGGSIRLGVTDAQETEARDRVRAHLQRIARAFAGGDFSQPAQIHDQTPPGVETLKARRQKLRYVYSDSPVGGVVTISTADPEALAAVHEFLRFQIRDHGTPDPLE